MILITEIYLSPPTLPVPIMGIGILSSLILKNHALHPGKTCDNLTRVEESHLLGWLSRYGTFKCDSLESVASRLFVIATKKKITT
jgi:hypothetical protein